MGTTTKEILAKLRLDSKEFIGKLDESHKSVLKVTAGITAVTAAVVAATKMTANYRDETIKAARAAGSTAEDFSALKYAADLGGTSIQQLTKGLRSINDPSKEVQKTLASLGVSLRDSSGNAKTQKDLLYDIADAIKGIEAPAQKSAAAAAIFGARNASMINMLAGGSEELRKLTAEAEKMGLTFDDKAGAASELFNDNIQRLTGSVKGMVMSFSEGIIELVNTSGIMTSLSGIVQGATGWWRSLDESTRSMITTVGAVVAGVAALVLVLAGVVAIAPAVKVAITAMTGGLNLVVLGVALAVAAFVAMAVSAAKYWDQVKGSILPAVDAITEAFEGIGDVFSPIYQSISGFAGSISDATGEVSVLGTITKAVFAVIGTAIIAVMGAFQVLTDTIALVGQTIYSLGEAFYYAVIKQDFDAAKNSLVDIGVAALKLRDDFTNTGEKIKASFSNIVVKVDTKEAKKSVASLSNEIKQAAGDANKETSMMAKKLTSLASDVSGYFGEYVTGWTAVGKIVFDVVGQIGKNIEVLGDKTATVAEKVGAVFSMIGNLASKLGSMIVEAITAPIQASIERLNRYMDIYTGLYSNKMADLIEATEAAEDEKISRLEAKYDEQIAMLEEAEKRKTAALEYASNERLLLLDEEYMAAKEAAEAAYEAWVEQETIRYETEKAMMLQKSLDKEQAMIVESLMDQDFKNYIKNSQANHDAQMKQMAADYSTKSKAENTALKEAQRISEEKSATDIKAITEKKNLDIESAEAAKNAKLQALEEKKAADEKKLKKVQMLMNWKAEQSEFRSTQGIKIASTIVSGVAGAAQAFAMAAGSIPIVGVILGAVLAAAVLAMTFASVAQMSAQQPPAAPAALFLATGGVMAGPSHAQGGISANLEGGEGVIDRARTEKLMSAVDAATQQAGSGMTFVFEKGSIVNNGRDADESLVDVIAERIARRMERQGVYA